MIDWGRSDLATTLGMPKEKIRFMSPFVGGGFGGKLFLRADAVLAALGAKAAGRPVKVALTRPLMLNNTHAPSGHHPAHPARRHAGRHHHRHRARERLGRPAEGEPETAVSQTKLLYAGANRLTSMRLAVLDLPEGNAMRAPGEAPGLMALEIAMDEMAEKLGMDPIDFRIQNDTQVDPENPERRSRSATSSRCLREGASASAGRGASRAGPGARRALAGRHGHGRGIPQQPGFPIRRPRAAGRAAASSRSRPT